MLSHVNKIHIISELFFQFVKQLNVIGSCATARVNTAVRLCFNSTSS